MALDDGYIYPTVVAMTSILENANADTKYDFYVMHPPEFQEENKSKIKSLEEKYSRCRINLIDMEDSYINASTNSLITTPAYYRLSLSDLLPDIDKIIWLDGDTLTFGDLGEMYGLDMEGCYYRGFLDAPAGNYFAEKYGRYICSGVMLINLDELRKNKMVSKFEEYIKNNNDSLVKHDQDVINYTCCEKIKPLPPKFGMFNHWHDAESSKSYADELIADEDCKYSREDMAEGFNNLTVLHCVWKPWNSLDHAFADKWWDYAKKTNFYEEIHAKYPLF